MSAVPKSNVPVPTEREWAAFYDAMLQSSGLDLSSYRPDQIRRRILSSLEAYGYTNLENLAQAIVASPAERSKLLDRLAINVSELYRNPESWESLKRFVLPELLGRRDHLRCWSAGCSNGGEAYSLATQLAELSVSSHEILATDIDTEALKAAQAAVYGPESVRSVPPETLAKYFKKTESGDYAVSQDIKRYVKFKMHSLFTPTTEKGFDLIICRNVVIYFTEEAKELLYRRFYEALAPGGYLFLGGSERIIDPNGIGYLNPLPFIYRK